MNTPAIVKEIPYSESRYEEMLEGIFRLYDFSIISIGKLCEITGIDKYKIRDILNKRLIEKDKTENPK